MTYIKYMVRAKFKVVSLTQKALYQNDIGTEIELLPVMGGDNASEENKKFFKYTPSGSVKLGTINPEAAAIFIIGKEYYLDFTLAE